MGVKIGDKVKIGDGNAIGDNAKVKIAKPAEEKKVETKNSWFNKHPFFTGMVLSFIVGFILLFSFWKDVIDLIEGLFK